MNRERKPQKKRETSKPPKASPPPEGITTVIKVVYCLPVTGYFTGSSLLLHRELYYKSLYI